MFENVPLSQSENDNNNFQSDYYAYTPKKPILKIVLFSLLALALLSGGAYYMYTKHPHLLSKNKSGIVTSHNQKKVEPVKTAEPAPTVVNSEIQPNTNGNYKYHIIAGAFVVEKNAASFMEDLQKKGYDPQIVLKRNEYSFISIYSCATLKEANTKYKNLEGSGMPLWIMKN